jgi:putative transposase
MPRSARIAAPNLPHHLCQRGHNRRDVFFGPRDYRSYLDSLAEFREALDLKVYGYCLMTNHIHLIVDPGANPSNLGLLMKRLAGRHTRRLNFLQQRSGTVWGGRFKCSPIETDRYLMTCLRYVDLNPVRARMVTQAEDYPWSSYRAHVGRASCEWLDVDPVSATITDIRSRQARYRQLVAEGENELELKFIRESLQRGHVTSSESFADALAREQDLVLPRRSPGRTHVVETKTGAEAPVIVDK